MKRLLPVFLGLLLVVGSANRKLDRLSDAERDHYDALRVWMDKKERKQFLKLKTQEERDAWLKAQGLWERFYQYDEDERDEIVGGAVEVGWTLDKVLMAWGPAHNRQRLAGRQAQRAEKLIYRFEVTPDKKVLVWEPKSRATQSAIKFFRRELILEDSVLVEIEQLEGW